MSRLNDIRRQGPLPKSGRKTAESPRLGAPSGYYLISFVVEGDAEFPMHMLATDRCCPVRPADASELTNRGARRVNLLRFTKAGKAGPRVESWQKYGWRVVDVHYHDGTVERP